MKRNNLTRFGIILVMLCSLSTIHATEFFKGSYLAAKEKALAEKKPLFVEFTTDWCQPCKWMLDNTYSDQQVSAFFAQNYVAVQVNVDNFDGLALKQRNNVKYLPTFIIYNNRGEEAGRYLESMNASKLLEVLKLHTDPDKKAAPAIAAKPMSSGNELSSTGNSGAPAVQVRNSSMDQAKADLVVTKETTANVAAEPKPIVRQPVTPPVVAEAKPKEAPKPQPKAEKPEPKPEAKPERNEVAYKPVSSEGSKGKVFSVQVGVFSSIANAKTLKKDLESKFISQEVTIREETDAKGSALFRVLIGKFRDKNDAQIFADQAKNKNVAGFVKEYSSL